MNPPDPAESGWETQERTPLCVTPHLAVYRERVATPHQRDGVEWLTVDRKAGVVIAPRLADGRWLLIHEDRIAPRRSFWSFPAGQIDAGADEGLSTARQELLEETGHTGGEWLYLGQMFSSPGFTNEQLHLWLADAVEPPTEPHAAEQAIRERRTISSEELRGWLENGTICDANTLSALTHLFARGLV